jgi:hypothetical protein
MLYFVSCSARFTSGHATLKRGTRSVKRWSSFAYRAISIVFGRRHGLLVISLIIHLFFEYLKVMAVVVVGKGLVFAL